jgi:hypothetical protein
MRRRYSWDERQGDLFGTPAPKPVAVKRPGPTKGEAPKEPPVQPASLTHLADMVNELGDEELAHLVVRGFRVLKRRLARSGQGGSQRAPNASRQSPLNRALQEIATELSGFDEPDADW